MTSGPSADATQPADRKDLSGDPSAEQVRHGVRHFLEQRDELIEELKAALGYMQNAQIDLQTLCPKKTAIRTLSGGIQRVRAALAKAEGRQ